MKKTSETIVFFGSGPVAKASLEFLLKNFTVEAIVTKPATQSDMTLVTGNIPVHSVTNADELNNLVMTQLFKSRVGVLVDFGVIVSKAVIDYFPLGIVNSHFSLLPEWRGADPITFSILSGQTKTGVSLMLIDEKMDTGKIIVQKSIKIDKDDTTESLTKRLIDLSNDLLADYVPAYLNHKVKPRGQPHPNRATYSRKLTKEDGDIDWSKPADQIEREIRAFKLWPKSRTKIGKKEVIITEAHVVEKSGQPGTFEAHGKQLLAYCGQNALSIDKLKPAGKGEMSSQAFLAGNKLD